MSHTLKSALGAILALAALGGSATVASGAEIQAFDATLSDYSAGGHPDARAQFELATEVPSGGSGVDGCGGPCRIVKGGAPRDIEVALPKGIVGNPRGLPQCTSVQLTVESCPQRSQVGFVNASLLVLGFVLPEARAVFNMVPERGEVAKLGMHFIGLDAFVSISLDASGDYRVLATSRHTPTALVPSAVDMTLWGVPEDSVHDPLRVCPARNNQFGCSIDPLERAYRPYVAAPAECGVDGFATLRVNTYQQPDAWDTATSVPQQVTGCDRLTFEPTMSAQPTTKVPDAPTGLDVDLELPQNFYNVTTPEAPPLKDAVVTLPEGLTINPGSAAGLQACSDEQLKLGSSEPMSCPLASKIGTVEAESPVLEGRLSGAVYLRPQASVDPESGDLFRLAIVIESERYGISVRLPGRVMVDGESGQVKAVFADNPQLPVSRIALSLKSGPRAPLATPVGCGPRAFVAGLSAWSGHEVERVDSVEVECASGLGTFGPSFEAGTTDSTGGGFSPFVVSVHKPDRQSAIDGLSMKLPEGLVANLKGNVGSQVGTVTALAGSGAAPYPLPGKVYLEGSYGDAPYSLRTVVPAKAGPFDLGEVVVRQKIYVDPETAQVSVVSDPLPTIVKGVPVRLQGLEVDVDRPGFVINPTSCERQTVSGVLRAATGQAAAVSTRFRASDCGELGFSPRLSMRLSGRKQARTGGHPALSAVLTQPKGQANTAMARVTLPPSIALDAVNSYDPKLVCDYDASLRADCPASTVIGKATAHTPVLNRPLRGAVHLVQGIRFGPRGNRVRTTPSLLVKLRGEVAINLRARSDVRGGRLVTTFPQVPDAPVSRFEMRINGGSKGILVVTRTRRAKINLCAGRQVADVQTDGHNGRQADYRTTVKTPCTKQARRARKALRAAR